MSAGSSTPRTRRVLGAGFEISLRDALIAPACIIGNIDAFADPRHSFTDGDAPERRGQETGWRVVRSEAKSALTSESVVSEGVRLVWKGGRRKGVAGGEESVEGRGREGPPSVGYLNDKKTKKIDGEV